MNSITPHFLDSLAKTVESNTNVMKVQVDTLDTVNKQMMLHYQNTEAKIREIDRVSQEAAEEYQRVEDYFKKVDEFERKIEGMEENYEHLNDTVSRIGRGG